MDYSGSFNGLTWGPGTGIHATSYEGLTGSPPFRNTDLNRVGGHGALYGRDLYGERVFTITWDLIPSQIGTTLDALAQKIETAMVLQQTGVLPMTLNNGTRMINCRPLDWDVPRSATNVDRMSQAKAQFRAADPFLYDAALQNVSLAMQLIGSGWVFPWTFPWTFSPVSTSPGTVTVYNTGSVETAPFFRVFAPTLAGFELRNLSTGAVLQVNYPAATGWVDVDMNFEQILFQGTADIRNYIVSGTDFWKLIPGANTVRFGSLGAPSVTTAALMYRSAYTNLRG